MLGSDLTCAYSGWESELVAKSIYLGSYSNIWNNWDHELYNWSSSLKAPARHHLQPEGLSLQRYRPFSFALWLQNLALQTDGYEAAYCLWPRVPSQSSLYLIWTRHEQWTCSVPCLWFRKRNWAAQHHHVLHRSPAVGPFVVHTSSLDYPACVCLTLTEEKGPIDDFVKGSESFRFEHGLGCCPLTLWRGPEGRWTHWLGTFLDIRKNRPQWLVLQISSSFSPAYFPPLTSVSLLMHDETKRIHFVCFLRGHPIESHAAITVFHL